MEVGVVLDGPTEAGDSRWDRSAWQLWNCRSRRTRSEHNDCFAATRAADMIEMFLSHSQERAKVFVFRGMNMTHSLTLEIPEKTYRTLAEKASKNGKGIEEIAVEKLSVPSPEDIPDPLDEFIGAFSSDIPDWGTNHDRYLGEALYRELRGGKR
jgi:hypothetical protein